MDFRTVLQVVPLSRTAGYIAAVAVPVAVTYASAGLTLPPFVFEHLVILLVLAIAIPWGLGPAVISAIVSVVSDNILLREPIGQPTITGFRDVVDLALFATVAVVVSGLMRRAHLARLSAQEAADRERRAREDRDRLIATVTHDLATPLAVLSNNVQLAKVQGATQIDWSRLLARLETATARATSLVRMLADVKALDTEDLHLDLHVHDLRTVIEPIVQMMDRLSDRHPVVLSVSSRPVIVRADAERLQRVLENLVNNAIKYSPAGGTIEVDISSDEHAAIVRVRDSGIGISPDALPYIFDRSFRASEAAKYAPGLGLGLSIARQVVAQHGGTISASSATGEGAEFIVRLPLIETRDQASGLAHEQKLRA